MKNFAIETNSVTAKYDYLWRLSDDRWAWEYARRSEKVNRYAESRGANDISEMKAPCADVRLLRSRVPQTMAERLGFVFMPDPAMNGLEADVVWTRQAYPDQVEVFCSALGPGRHCALRERMVSAFDITHVTDSIGREYLLIHGKGCVVQVRCTGLSLLGMEPVMMNLSISDIGAYERKLKAQKAALAILGDDPESQPPQWTKRTQILRNGLIAIDGLKAGLSRREIAELLHGKDRVAADWNGPSLRHAMRYLVRKAEGLRDGGYLVELLGSELGIYRKAS
ncbi:DUF2285 domain-containing protein [Parvularcula flava]|uniref:DUF2285 domain-containing protein n=1 Tax=Aquisalinus luteolus TaxID=1566827 RepID=A0A8J3EP51_9PROT|nr:DUF2285 domain-containing protein [Aquisalinus luteolus]NHK27121.1 DUF2285 domain-containing protein [Aquisalinus luteolus]GGH94440.1 hypothetical protein GCM10011355_08630 [Aquisalinus luteolus]